MTYLTNKNILFITTKNLDYIRNTQEIDLLSKKTKSIRVLGSHSSSYIIRLCSVYIRLLFMSLKGFDTIFIGFAPQLILPLFYHRFKGKTICIDFFISLFDTLCYDRQKIKANSILGKSLHLIDAFTLKHCDAIICDTKTHGAYFVSEFAADEEKIQTLYLHADTNIYHPITVERPEYLKNKFVVLYFGSILPLQGVDIVLHAMSQFSNHPKLYFICIGPISHKNSKIVKPESTNIQYINWLPQTELAKKIAMADLCLAGHFHPTIEKAKRTIPGKAFIYQAMKKPMILGDNPANHELFEASSMIQFVEMGNAVALANAILQSIQ